ncbi:transglycosylase domain-containing protein [Paenibacillus sp. SC116]|uniref:transglycosylase domain-containing protein n=1 Tax=Paenibacillus sp. SC116 TaxID=2968986 RepID=UPI00215AF24D|nr:transglycosylase domain-containing protein [Paenibacillus sp. SC116]MCR8845666.1 transglycosylase domain-containing protein [Paenibacillus sp. SC116]
MVEETLTKSKGDPTRPKRSVGRIIWNTFKWFTLFGVLCCFLAGGIAVGYITSLVKDDPIRSKEHIVQKVDENAISGFAYFNDGTLIGQLRTEEDRIPIKYDQIPQVVINALIATEDNRFFEHNGIDIRGTSRAVLQQVLDKPVQTGGSTLTQQLARRVFLNTDRTATRKAKEIFLSLRIERILSKEQILEAYLNKVPFGNGSNGYQVFGIKAAAKGIFNVHDLEKLNIAQAAYLAGLPQLPSAYTAFTGKGAYNEKGIKRAIERQKLVLKRMLEEQKITQQQYEEALKFDIRKSLAQPKQKAYSTYPYLMLDIERAAVETLILSRNPEMTKADLRKEEHQQLVEDTKAEVLRGGYHITTTIDKKIYKMMRNIAEDPKNFSKDHPVKGTEQVAAMMIDHRTGAILGMIEGRDFYKEQMNHATQMLRQPGSTMKTLAAFLPALEKGIIQPASIIDDAPVILKNGDGTYHIPINAGRKFQGLVTARHALNQSLNAPAIKLFNEELKVKNAWDFVEKLGITTLHERDYQAQTGVIGGLTNGVTVEEFTNAYAAIANNGKLNDAFLIHKIVDSNGKEVYKHQVKPTQVVSPQTAYLMTDMLRTAVTNGTGGEVNRKFRHDDYTIVGKTGTTQNDADSWFIGYSPDVTLGVWVGFKEPKHTLSRNEVKHSMQVWAKIMNEAIELKPQTFKNKTFKRPDGIVRRTVSGYSGKLPSKNTDKFNTDLFNSKYVPTKVEDVLVSMTYITYNGVNYIANPATPSDMTQQKVVVKREKPIQTLMEELRRALGNLSSGSSRRSLDWYLPLDASTDAPTKKDPRKDDGKAPTSPSSVSVTSNNGKATISFNPSGSNDVVGYRLYRSIDGKPYQQTGQVVLAGDSYTFSNGVSNAHRYNYYVTAVDVVGKESAASATASLNGGTPPADPNSGNATDPSSEPGTNPGNSSGSTSSETPGSNGQTTNGNGSSETGSTNNESTQVVAPSAPSGLSASKSAGGVSLSWNSSATAVKYYVYHKSSQGGSYKRIGNTNSTSFTYTSDAPQGSYHVTAENRVGESSASSSVTIE